MKIECHCYCMHVQSYLILCNPMNHSPPGPSVSGIFQTRILEWDDISFSRGSFQLGIKPMFPVSPALPGGFFSTVPPMKLRMSLISPQWGATASSLQPWDPNVREDYSIWFHVQGFLIQIMYLWSEDSQSNCTPNFSKVLEDVLILMVKMGRMSSTCTCHVK